MFAKIKYAFVLLFLLCITTLTVQGTVLGSMKDSSIVKKKLNSTTVPVSEEEEDETAKAEEEIFLNGVPLFVVPVSSIDIVWPSGNFLLCFSYLNIQNPPPEL